MTHSKKVMMIFSGILFLFSCTKKEAFIDPIENDVEVSFRTTISAPNTRATGTLWEANDAIGIFALKKGEPLHNDGIYENMANIEYRNDEPGLSANFKAVSTPILFPGDGKKLDFVAYYPYTTSITQDYQLPINLTNQSPLSAIDILYATAIEQSKHNPHVALTFKHQLSQVVFPLTAADDISLEGISITIENARTHGTMNLSDGTIELGTSTGIIAPVTTVDIVENSAVATAILLPGQAMDDLLVRFELADESIYYWEPTTLALTPSTRYHYALNFISGDVEMDGDGSIIEDWDDGYTGDPVELEPSETGDEGRIIVKATKTELESTGGSTTLQITVPEGTEWTATTEVDWLTLGTPVLETRGSQSIQTATGSANMEVTAQPNTNPEPRTGIITVCINENNYTAAITQAADDPDPTPVATDLFISEYVCGDNNNYYLEIFNGTGREVDLSNYRVIVYPNGLKINPQKVKLSGTLGNKQVVVLGDTESTLYTGEHLEDGAIHFVEGNNAIMLEKTIDGGETDTVLDIFGRIGVKETAWTAEEGYTTNLKTLRRKPSVRSGVTENPESGFPTLATEWDLYDLNDISGLGEHIME